MTTRRLWLVYTLLAIIVGGSMIDVLFKGEHWPFSWYAMYAGRQDHYSLQLPLVYGVTASATPQEIRLQDAASLAPFDNSRLTVWLSSTLAQSDPKPRLTLALHDILRRYEAARRAGRHMGPPLQAVRLYRVYWDLEPWARNRDEPTQRELVLEVRD